MTETHYPGLTFASIGPMQGMHPNCCAAPSWVSTYGGSKLHEMLTQLGVPSNQHGVYENYFRQMWENRKANPPAECDPNILRKIEALIDDLRTTKGIIFGE